MTEWLRTKQNLESLLIMPNIISFIESANFEFTMREAQSRNSFQNNVACAHSVKRWMMVCQTAGSQNLRVFSHKSAEALIEKYLQVISSINICGVELCSREQLRSFFQLWGKVLTRLKYCKKLHLTLNLLRKESNDQKQFCCVSKRALILRIPA